MRCILNLLVFILFFTGSDAIATENTDIDYLLASIESSGCTFIRNGKEYSAEEAGEHLRNKYTRVQSRIKTVDEFIDKIASRSSVSKKPYKVRCAGTLLPARQWLADALTSRNRTVKN